MMLHRWYFGDSPPIPGFVQSYEETSDAFGDEQTIDVDPTFSGEIKDFYSVNGQYAPTLTIEANRTHLMRFIHAAGYDIVQLQMTNFDDCEMQLIARDGVFHYTPYL